MGKLFSIGPNISANACVGENGWGQTYWNYADGFYAAYKIIYEKLSTNYYSEVDSLIFPLIYTARHAVELYLKKLIFNLVELRRNVTVQNNIKFTHSLATIWDFLVPLLSQDRRFEENAINIAKSTIFELDKFDITGATFRYPESTDEIMHLKDIRIINIDVFSTGIKNLFEILDYWAYVADFLLLEYEMGTYTTLHSREDIKNFAIEIRAHLTENITIKETETLVRNKHAISSREWSKICSIIWSNREFSSIVFEPHDLKHASKDDIFIAIVSNVKAHQTSKTKNYIVEFDNYKTSDLISSKTDIYQLKRSLSRLKKNILADICAVYSMGHGYDKPVYCELYDSFLQNQMKNTKSSLVYDIVESNNFLELFYKGLKILGATHMLIRGVKYEQID